MKVITAVFFAGAVAASLVIAARRPAVDFKNQTQKVGEASGDETLVATGQEIVSPTKTVTFGSRPVDMVLSPDSKFAFLKTTSGIVVIDVAALKVVNEVPIKEGTSMMGIAISVDGYSLAVTDAGKGVHLFDVFGSTLTLRHLVKFRDAAVGGSPYPCGVAFDTTGAKLYVALSRANLVCKVDAATGEVQESYPVDVAPCGVALDEPRNRLLVTCWAATPGENAVTAKASGSPVEVDRRGIAVGGTLCVIDLVSGAVATRLPVGLQPTEVHVDGRWAFLSASNSDRVVKIDLKTWDSEDALPLDREMVGSAPSSLAIADNMVFTACGGRNTIVRRGRLGGRLEETRTPWYPIAVRLSGQNLLVACNKGMGMRQKSNSHAGWSTYDFQGSFTVLGPETKWEPLAKKESEFNADSSKVAMPVPARPGDPSLIEHVVYILKENRTYDQVLGDIGKGDSDPSLTIFGKEITPNEHALADQFVLLDNYYCNGVLSADGHAWAMEGNATNYFERSFGGWTRSYPFGGDDPLAVSRSGFLWDNVLDHGKTVRNYGECDYASVVPSSSYEQVLQDFQSGSRKIGFKQDIAVKRIRELSHPGFPGWNLNIPDVLRADIFIKDLARMEGEKSMPNLVIIYLPQDHTSGTNPGGATPRANVADNDLAVGRVVEAISKSSFWPKTAIFVNEDDPQAGFDHVDGHRSFCLVVSPYSKRKAVVSNFYNQTSVMRTINHMLGLPAMNRFDASSPLMTDCFQPTPDLTPYTALPNLVPLDEVNPPKKGGTVVRLDKPDMADEKVMNRLLWAAMKGPKNRYPSQYEGAHGLGLSKRGLKLANQVERDAE